jgi:hypothetical protein
MPCGPIFFASKSSRIVGYALAPVCRVCVTGSQMGGSSSAVTDIGVHGQSHDAWFCALVQSRGAVAPFPSTSGNVHAYSRSTGRTWPAP